MNFEQSLTHYIPQIQAEMQRLMAPARPLDPFYGMMHYHLGWLDHNLQPAHTATGKLLRPLYTMLACRAAGGQTEQALPAAAAVELIHNFSLIHDDIEDQSDTRRGRATVWALWGEAQAINAGDTLFTLARRALFHLEDYSVPDKVILQAIRKLDDTCLALCRGQYLDMSFEQTLEVDLPAYLEMIEGKTASLLACSGYLGGLIATANPAQAEVYWQLGLSLGLAFQIHDDLLGIWGDEAVTGKPSADDLRRKKKSLPVVFALNHSDTPRASRLKAIYNEESASEADIAEAITILEALGANAYAEAKAKEYVVQAQTALESIDSPLENKLALQEMAAFFIERSY